MAKNLSELISSVDLETIEPDLFRGPAADTQLQRTYGGQVLAQAVLAAYHTVSDRTMHSLHGYFLRPGRAEAAIIYDVEKTRDGEHFSVRRVSARQDGHQIFTMTGSFQAAEEGVEHMARMPVVPEPDQCPRIEDVLTARYGPGAASFFEEWQDLEVRYAGGGIPGQPEAQLQVWVRARGRLPDDPAFHQAVLAYLSDLTILSVSLLPHGLVYGPGLVAASLDHAMWFHRPCRADEWMLYDQTSPSASGARGYSQGRIFANGALVADIAQEGLIRVV